ncbi:MAG: sulfatase-like hydrolase/transferase, partial [Proteobacteria bacterium]|nr:sulfatase-like hydrolase/transferase [Pseudomonadota bacterium]
RFIIELMRNGNVVQTPADNDLLTSLYTDEAVRFLNEAGDAPFFLFLSYNAPHTPLGVHPDFAGKSKAGRYGDAVEELDWSVGRILAALEKQRLSENTLVIFVSDNGPETRSELGDDIGSAGPFRGGKYSNWEGGVRVPAIWRWPGVIPKNQHQHELTTLMDIYPTLAHLAGAELPDRTIDGYNILPLLKDEAAAVSPYDVYYYHMLSQLQAVRKNDWKLVLPRRENSPHLRWLGRYMDTVSAPQLYDLASDPGETRNIADKHPDVVKALLAEADKGRQVLGDINRIGAGARFFDNGPPRPETYFPNVILYDSTEE